MGNPKQKYCKCGHNQKDHKKNPDSKFSFTTYCRNCQCTSYMNRDLPNKSSYGFLILAVGLGIILVGITAIVFIEADPKITGTEDTTITFTLSELYEILFLLFLVANIFFIMWFIVDPILAVLSEKKRRKFPIRDD